MLTKKDLTIAITAAIKNSEKRQDKRFEKRLSDHFDNFRTYMDEVLDQRFHLFREEIRSDFSEIRSLLDILVKRDVTYGQEIKVMGHRMTRSESWMKRAGHKIGLKFET